MAHPISLDVARQEKNKAILPQVIGVTEANGKECSSDLLAEADQQQDAVVLA